MSSFAVKSSSGVLHRSNDNLTYNDTRPLQKNYCSPKMMTTSNVPKRPQSFHKFFLAFVVLLLSMVLAKEEETCAAENGECTNPDKDTYDKHPDDQGKIRMVTREELSLYDGVPTEANNQSKSIWLSILGEVYDVTTGTQYYAKGAGYAGMSARDCSLCFVSGTFTQEEGDKETSEIPFDQLPALLDWRNFYADHKTYEFVGYLLDDRYYDENAKPTPKMLELRERVKHALAAAEIKKAERAKKREEMKKKREEEKKNKLKVEEQVKQ
jgi:hypothetical protein